VAPRSKIAGKNAYPIELTCLPSDRTVHQSPGKLDGCPSPHLPPPVPACRGAYVGRKTMGATPDFLPRGATNIGVCGFH